MYRGYCMKCEKTTAHIDGECCDCHDKRKEPSLHQEISRLKGELAECREKLYAILGKDIVAENVILKINLDSQNRELAECREALSQEIMKCTMAEQREKHRESHVDKFMTVALETMKEWEAKASALDLKSGDILRMKNEGEV